MTTVQSQGVTFKIGDGGSPTETFNDVGELRDVTGLRGGGATVIDASTLASTRREKVMGLPDEGQCSLSVWYDPADSQQTALEAARDSRALTNFQVTIPSTPVTTFAFSGFVLDFEVGAQIDGLVEGSVTIEITGAVTKS